MPELTDLRKAEIEEYVSREIWSLNASGNLERIIDIFFDFEKDFSGYTPEKVGKSYIDYFNKWSYEHEGQEDKYIGKDDKLMDIYNFITKRSYQNEFAIIRKGRDFYLFGDMQKEELKAKLESYKASIAHGRK